MINNKLVTYNSIVKTLQNNDHNGTWYEILKSADDNFTYAIMLLELALNRVITDDGLEGEELDFFVSQFERVQEIR
jgi:hypothetical protein